MTDKIDDRIDDKIELPSLPEPSRNFGASEFTADQLREYGESCARAAMERCAVIVLEESVDGVVGDAHHDAYNTALINATAAIRASIKGK